MLKVEERRGTRRKKVNGSSFLSSLSNVVRQAIRWYRNSCTSGSTKNWNLI